MNPIFSKQHRPNTALDAGNVSELRRNAKRRLPKALFEFFDRGSEDETAQRAARLAFNDLRIRPRVMVDVSGCSTAITLFGKSLGAPIIAAPTGVGDLLWPDGEMALARAAGSAGLPFTLSMSSTTSVEKLSAPGIGPFWFQLYLWDDRRHSREVVERAQAAGASALVLTVDTAVTANREYNTRNGMSLPFRPSIRTTIDFARHPGWFSSVVLRYRANRQVLAYANYPQDFRGPLLAGPRRQAKPAAFTWEDLRWLRKIWHGPLLVKGILTASDGKMAVDCGADGIVVSNHGGRTLDSAVLPIDALPEIVDAVGHRTTVLADGGIRRGSDVAKLLALGAKAVLVGRAPLYGLASAGEAGARRSFELLATEFRRTMALAGINRVDELTDEVLAASSSTRLMAQFDD